MNVPSNSIDLTTYEDLATRTLAAIDTARTRYGPPYPATYDADRERVASDLALLDLAHVAPQQTQAWRDVYAAAADGLRRTAALYGVTL